jgi:hypothetical protein
LTVEQLNADGAGPSEAKRLRGANERPENPPIAE